MAALHRSLAATEVPRFAPHALAQAWADAPLLALLENPGEPNELGRYAYVCRDPFWQLSSKRARCWSGPPSQPRSSSESFFVELEHLLVSRRTEAFAGRGEPLQERLEARDREVRIRDLGQRLRVVERGFGIENRCCDFGKRSVGVLLWREGPIRKNLG